MYIHTYIPTYIHTYIHKHIHSSSLMTDVCSKTDGEKK